MSRYELLGDDFVQLPELDAGGPPQVPPPPVRTAVADPGERQCPLCRTEGTYLYQGLGYWYCGACDHGDWDDDEGSADA